MATTSFKQTRKYMRAEITKTHNSILSSLASYSNDEKRQVMVRLRSLQSDIKELDQKILMHLIEEKVPEDEAEAEYESSANYEKKVIASLTTLESSLGANQSQGGLIHNVNRLKFPELPLPEYGHREGEDLNKFLTNFENIVNKYSLSSYEKFIFLQKQLSNEALTLIRSLEIGSQNYESAKELLKQAFASSLTQQYATIERLSQMSLPYDGDPYEYIGKMRVLTESFKSLKIDTDVILQYFFWKGMNDNMQTQFIHITNSNKPSLKEINKHIFEATERYMSVSKHVGGGKGNIEKAKLSLVSKPVASNLAVNVGYSTSKNGSTLKRSYCSICTGKGERDTSHSTSQCTAYPTPASKIDRIKALRGCFKCGNCSHETNQCKFRFNRSCFHCSQYHFSFLCMSKVDNGTGFSKHANKDKATKIVNSGTAVVGNGITAFTAQYGENVVVPTFTLTVGDNYTLRGMRDTGCQPNFITDKAAKDLNLNVLESNVPLTIHGFNSSNEILTRIVELYVNPSEPPIQAICVPFIRTKINLPGLSKVVKSFTSRGYSMADKYLMDGRDEIANLDLFLGNIDAQILPMQDVTFGCHPYSMYSDSSLGILLSGSISRYNDNLMYLPAIHTVSNIEVNSTRESPLMEVSLSKVESGLIIRNSLNSMNIQVEIDPNLSGYEKSEFTVMNDSNHLDESALGEAVEAVLKDQYCNILNYDKETYEENNVESNQKLTKYVLDNTTRSGDGRLVMPLLWNGKVCELLGTNYNLSKAVLSSNLRKLQRNKGCLEMYDEVFRDQVKAGIIERIDNLPKFLEEYPGSSFLPHMGVFKLDRESTKCRVVYLSNICESDPSKPKTISHNQAMLSGPNLNKKISTSLMELRFDEYLLCFDIKKAFLNISLSTVDQNRLLFLWYKNVSKGDFTVVGYRSLRLAFGLRCSPAILMLALFKILVLDTEHDLADLKDLKKLVYSLSYMDNCAVTSNSPAYLEWAYDRLSSIFGEYQFSLQQFVTNLEPLQSEIEMKIEEESLDEVKLFGLKWNKSNDSLLTKPLKLDGSANTKRRIMSTIASNFDLFQFNGPILNRTRLFAHKLQCEKGIGWDDVLDCTLLKEWKNISNQVNGTPAIPIKRFVGRRDGEFRLIAFTDASKLIFGVVIYIQDLRTNEVNFLIAKNRIVNKQLETKSIPSLEFNAIALGTRTLIELYNELSGGSCVIPIKIKELKLYSDSMVSLHWINAYVNKLDKMQKRSAFVMNRLDYICKLCESFPVSFSFIAGVENPADCITRPLSYKQLLKSNYLSGPDFLSHSEASGLCIEGDMSFTVPYVHGNAKDVCSGQSNAWNASVGCTLPSEPLIPVDKYSSFHRLLSVYRFVIKFVNNVKLTLRERDPDKYAHFVCYEYGKDNLYSVACNKVILFDQANHFGDILSFFAMKSKTLKNVPNLVGQLNLFKDKDGLLRVKSKFDRWKESSNLCFPILVSKESKLVQLIVSDIHVRLAHAGCYSVLSEFRKQFYVPHHFSVVKGSLRKCVTCKRMNERAVKLNQSSYRDFRVSPPSIPFRYIFLDHFGPYWIRYDNKKVKAWILCITCLWSRAINLKVCLDMTVKEFLRTIQLHVFEYGIPELVLSDMGSQLVAGSNIISDFLKDADTQLYLEARNIRPIKFQQYFRGCNELGSLVESCVKLSKRLIHGAIKNTVLSLIEFDFVVQQTVSLVNKRPIAFKDVLRDGSSTDIEIPAPITPEVLLKGHDLITINVIPLSVNSDPEWKPEMDSIDFIKCNFAKLNKVRERD